MTESSAQGRQESLDSRTLNAIVHGADERFAANLDRVRRDTDRLFAWLMVGQWVFGVFLAFTFSPYGWAGKVKTVHAHVYAATILGAVISSLPLLLALRRPGAVVTRHVVAAGQMLWSALLIHLSGGRIETHFHVFGSLAFLAFYRDWRVLVTASVVVAADHFVRGVAWPESVYGVLNPESWRFLEHAFWVAFIDVFLTISCLRGLREMRSSAEQGAMLEARTLLPATVRAGDAGGTPVQEFAKPERSSFDEVQIEGAIGWRTVTWREYEAMPLGDRIQLIVQNKVRFLRNGRPISTHEALGAARV